MTGPFLFLVTSHISDLFPILEQDQKKKMTVMPFLAPSYFFPSPCDDPGSTISEGSDR